MAALSSLYGWAVPLAGLIGLGVLLLLIKLVIEPDERRRGIKSPTISETYRNWRVPFRWWADWRR
jgi:hypothetical protein